ncbi:hypothetical protein PGTUg99_022933 [Puccinia graminis f. sp. tritici]|uniref:Uncharacterized protein n=1 Tax=Puccinia graminis f. sp. tritici TaxID=56615 RepID=A0A5B0MYQ8_PUCGR|nr:hypothetical protein PGTUg99_022933 [Puccinia graminis f. sp. tritici]
MPSLANTTFSSWERSIGGYCMQHGLYEYLTTTTKPTDAAELKVYNSNRLKTAGILTQHMGDNNFNRLKAAQPPLDKQDPAVIWKFLTDYYQSTAVENKSKVYQDYHVFTFRKDLATFLHDLDTHLGNLSSVGFIIGDPIGAV